MRTLKKFLFILLAVAFNLTKAQAQTIVQPYRFQDNSFTQQVNIGVGVARTTNASAYLEVGPASNGIRGFLPPRTTTTLRNSISSPANGLHIYNTITNRPNYFNGTTWVDLFIDTSNKWVNTIYRIPGIDSIYIQIGNTVYAIKDSTGGSSGWNLTGNTVSSYGKFLGTLDNFSVPVRTNNVEVAIFDSLGARLYLKNGLNPLLSLKQLTSDKEYQLRIGINTGVANTTYNLYDATLSKIRWAQSGQTFIVGNTTTPYSSAMIYAYGGTSGANIDAQPDSTQWDEGNIEVMKSDYATGEGIAMRGWGNVGVSGSVLGYLKKNMGVLDFNNQMNLIRVLGNRSLRFGTNDTERMVLDSNGRVGINVVAPSEKFEVSGNAKVSGTGNYFTGRWRARVDSTASSATPTINTDNVDIFKITALAANITSMTTNLSGTPNDGDIIELVITGTAARTISWGSSFVSTTIALPTTTVSTTTLTVVLQYYTSSSYGNGKWHCVNYY